jgi:hypothetical protein
MALPAAVAKNAARAAELAAAAAAGARASAGTNANTDIPNRNTEAPAPAAADVAKLQADLRQAQEDLAAAMRRYAVLKGKYDAEVPALTREKTALTNRVTELEALLARKVDSGDIADLSDDEKKLLGPDMMRVVQKIARGAAVGEIDTRLKPVNERFTNLDADREATYWATLNSGAPGWEQQNEDPKFIAWLNDLDPTSGRLRMDVLKRYEGAKDGHGVLEVFRAYREKREIGGAAKPPAADPLVNREAPPVDNSHNPDPNQDTGKGKRWTRQEIQQFYRDKRERKYAGKDEEARAIELDIFAAQREGRVAG